MERESYGQRSYPLTIILYIINKIQYRAVKSVVSGTCFKASWDWGESGAGLVLGCRLLKEVWAPAVSKTLLKILHMFEILHNKKFKKTSHPPQ